jgi:hypothetical protein
MVAGRNRVGLREHFLAWLLYSEDLPIDVRCPECSIILEVIPFPHDNGVTIRCVCGTCAGTLKGL